MENKFQKVILEETFLDIYRLCVTIIKTKAMTVQVENHFPAERGDRRLKIPFGTGGDRISHASCIFEPFQMKVENAVKCTLRTDECLYRGECCSISETCR